MLILGIGEVFAQIGIWIVSGIYKVASTAFEIFLVLADGSLLASIDYNTIINNFYLIIAVVMLFILSFSLLKGMVNPDDQKQGTATVKKVIINLITSVIIMAILPFIFTFAFDFQKSFINDYNPIGKFFGYGSLDSNVSDNSSVDTVKYGANQIVNGVFTAFFNVSLDACEDDGYVDDNGNVNVKECQASTNIDRLASGNYSFTTMMTRVERTGNFNVYEQFAPQVDKGKIDFNFLLSLIGGLLLIYVGVSYCFDMALRLVKLAFYQIIAPIPIFFRVIPEGKLSGTFNTWVKVTLTCYLEVYVRIFVFYFCIYLCKEMLSAPFFDNLSGRGFWVSNLSLAFVLMGIITFMRQAPKLISEITGLDSGNMKLGIRDKLAAGGAFTAGALVGGGLTAGVRNLTNAGQNVVNKYQQNRKDGKGRLASAFGASGTAIRGLGSVAAGTISGGVRAGKSGWGAKSFSDMKNSASKGAADAIEARENRATYKSRHGNNIVGVTIGHAKDALDSVGRWAGFDNINVLLSQQKTINELQSQRKAIDNESFDVIDGDLAKGKAGVSYDSTNAAHLGVTHDMVNLRRLKAELDAAKASGIAADIANAEVAYSKYRADWADELRDIALKGEKNWSSVDRDVQADLAKVRIATDKYRESVSRNYTASYVSSLPNASDILDKEKDLSVSHSTLKQIKDEMKISETQITNQINRIRQKENDKKGK